MNVLPPSGSRVAFYSRYSTALQNGSSIAGQELLCETYAQRQQWVEAGRYSDAERSGTTTMGRQGLFQMLAAAERGEFDVLLVEDIDRTSRDAADMHRIAKDLDELDVTLCTVSGGVVTDIELAFKAVQNQQFIKQNAAKSKRGQELVVASGRMSGSVPYGYRKVIAHDAKGEPINGLREIDPDKAAIVRRAHEDYDAGKTTFQICAAFNAEGIPSPKGKLWRPGSLLGNKRGGLGILRNPIYMGEFQFRKTRTKRRKGRLKTEYTALAERIVVAHPELVIIDKDLWDRVQARLDAASDDRPFHSKKKVEYLFSGKVVCGKCGSNYAVTEGKFACTGRQQKGVCDNGRRVPRKVLEDTVLARIKEHLLSAELLEPCLSAYREEAERALAEQAEMTKGAATRLTEIDQRIANLMAQLGAAREANFASQIVLQEIERLGAEKMRLEHQTKLAPRPLRPSLDAGAVIARLGSTLDALQAALESDDREAVRAQGELRGLVDRLILEPAPGTTADGRGAGDLRVTVEGPLAALIDLADLSVNRVAKYEHRPTFVLGNATSVYRFSYVLVWRDPRLAAIHADLPLASKLLDEADIPVTVEAFEQAFATDGVESAQRVDLRVRNVVAYLQAREFTRCVNTRSATTGYVWVDRGLSDAEWKARITHPPMTRALPVIRVSGPEATVVVIGPRGEA